MSTLAAYPRPLRRGLAALALVVAVVASTTTSYADGVAGPVAGAPGIGDPYFPADGNGGIDVLRYDIHDTYAFGPGRLSGWTRLTIRATQSLSSFNLDFLLGVSEVKVDGEPASFTKPTKHELKISPQTSLREGETSTVVVHYSGKPGPIPYEHERNWLADDTEVITMNQPHMAPWWFPANDHPADKAAFDIHITVPGDRKVVANGRLVDRVAHRGSATTHWRATEPMAPYLAFFAAGKFETRKGSYDGRPWYVAVSKLVPDGPRRGMLQLMKKSAKLTAWLEGQLGPYPFSTTGGLITGLPIGFALENQTRPTYPTISPNNIRLVVHELAHQWFGDSVSVERWSDIWLNEGFATFLEVRYEETHGGPSGPSWLQGAYGSHDATDPFWKLKISDPGAKRIFADAVYDRGAMTLQALRQRVGESDFWLILRGWAATHRHGNGSDADFRAYAGSVSGEDLGGFFTAWLDAAAKPAPTAENGLAPIATP